MKQDRKSTRLNSSHVSISYAVFCLKKHKKHKRHLQSKSIVVLKSRATTKIYTLTLHDALPISRALASDPNIILMDEPFSALDPISREQLQYELKLLQKKIQKTIVFVTHDMDEA